MEKKSKIVLGVLLLLIIGSVGATYWRIVVEKDYTIQAQADCDPTVDKCFVWECDPQSIVEGEMCTGDPDKDIWYYQLISRKAANIPLCDPDSDENCRALACEEGENDCSITFCDDTNKEAQGAECNDPVQYTIDNPVEDALCEEGDEECASLQDEGGSDETGAVCDPAGEECPVDAGQDNEASDQ